MVAPPPFSSQHYSDSYSIISASAIDFVVSEIFESHGKNKLEVAMAKYLESVSVRDGGASEESRSLFNCLAPSTSLWKNVTSVVKDHSIDEGYQDYIMNEILK